MKRWLRDRATDELLRGLVRRPRPRLPAHRPPTRAATAKTPNPDIGSGSFRCPETSQGGGRGIRTHGDVAATMVFKSIRGSASDTAATWAFIMSVFCGIQDHPAHIPRPAIGLFVPN
jgi:hypothetical protein